jgi:quinol monooxygenase YgiN
MSERPEEIVIFATARAAPGMEAALEQALRDVADPTLAQPGCLGFELYRSKDGSTITAVERWTSKADHERHIQGAHVQELLEKFDGILVSAPTISEMEGLLDAPLHGFSSSRMRVCDF